ncbi:hypothetical protein P7K49_009320 [Saguinus oedipus]|uniref:Uncharacterized protein n=1 Tax=Saguinus oedipus TaxID=9490 RepID=A0ABQ9VJM5_SAGOE|nr:hypothetical protein P7K49_009320 [Saguinus oedipus]
MTVLELTGDLQKCIYLIGTLLSFVDLKQHTSSPGKLNEVQTNPASLKIQHLHFLPLSSLEQKRGCLWQAWYMVLRLAVEHPLSVCNVGIEKTQLTT